MTLSGCLVETMWIIKIGKLYYGSHQRTGDETPEFCTPIKEKKSAIYKARAKAKGKKWELIEKNQ